MADTNVSFVNLWNVLICHQVVLQYLEYLLSHHNTLAIYKLGKTCNMSVLFYHYHYPVTIQVIACYKVKFQKDRLRKF